MQKIDIRKVKNEYRAKAKEYRASLSSQEKEALDDKIFQNLFSLEKFLDAKTVLCYMSTPSEINTRRIISKLFSEDKTVALPRCIDDSRDMEFFCITSFDQTEKHTFGVYEPTAKKCERLRDFRNSVCILPGLGFDREGYRLGYGKGYYDRFLSSYKGIKIGICYEKCVFEELPRGFFDVSADIVVTETEIIYIKNTKGIGKNYGRKKDK